MSQAKPFENTASSVNIASGESDAYLMSPPGSGAVGAGRAAPPPAGTKAVLKKQVSRVPVYLRKIIIVYLVIIFLVGLFSGLYVVGIQRQRDDGGFVNFSIEDLADDDKVAIGFGIVVQSVDLDRATASLRIVTNPFKALIRTDVSPGTVPLWKYDITMYIGSQTVSVKKNTPAIAIDINTNLLRITESIDSSFIASPVYNATAYGPAPKNASILPFPTFKNWQECSFPFDQYIAELPILATYIDPARPNVTSNIQPFFVFTNGLTYVNINAGFSDYFKESEEGDIVEPALLLNIRRSDTAIAFSVALSTIMWILAITVFSNALYIICFGKKAEPPMLAFHATMLFALPALRNAQPNPPPTGSALSDVVGFFWNMILLSIALIMVIIKFLMQHLQDAAAAEVAAKKKEAEKKV